MSVINKHIPKLRSFNIRNPNPVVDTKRFDQSIQGQSMGIIYKITNLINNKIYIGQTTRTLKVRWQVHCNVNGCSAMHNAIKKYGKDNFKYEILEKCNILAELNDREIYWIKELNSKYPSGYNLTDGGDGVLGRRVNNEIREKISRTLKEKYKTYKHHSLGTKASDETKIKMGLKSKGRKLSEETKNKIRLSKLGEKNPTKRPEVKEKLRISHLGQKRKHTKETIEKIRIANTGVQIVKKCISCDKTFKVRICSMEQKYCSYDCYHKEQRINSIYKKNYTGVIACQY